MPDMFSPSEMVRLWNRMRESRRGAPQAAIDAWQRTDKLGARAGKSQAKRQILWMWLKDPSWGRLVLHEESIQSQTKEQGSQATWVSRGRLEQLVGTTEAKQLIDHRELEVRDHPSRPGQQQWLYEEEYSHSSRKRELKHTCAGNRDMTRTSSRRCGAHCCRPSTRTTRARRS